jgi:excisionase family DNA binding protein
MIKEFYTSKEVCELLRIAYQTLWRYKRDGKLKAVKISPRKLLYPKSEIDKFLAFV